ncbi:outer membrane lipoprotein chaperone LolA [Thalassotalea ponticola]|uniref:outer membrane lipoprotein chaperone LolA n=1 Tax=Thalassotalea ponticola TaxID=1523392 RepID=UPI0025B31877|nr:outer membrane lipoprotein chaperone LolA [Thalassotalea ponticola]MDN3651453.1 outer membrane lipoprotein chaperone LolA [Thalassotalea ponticola]
MILNKIWKRTTLSCVLAGLTLASPLVFGALDYKQALQQKLAKVDGFSAEFSQQVIDADGNEIQQSTGNLALKRPNLLHWQTVSPDETLVVSDGDTLWFYNPFVEQVTAFRVDNAVANTPILLLSGLNEQAWQDYQVSKRNDNEFTILATKQDAQVTSLHIVFNGDQIDKFTVVDATGQLSHFDLTDVVSTPLPNAELFSFEVPEGVDLDDQR